MAAVGAAFAIVAVALTLVVLLQGVWGVALGVVLLCKNGLGTDGAK